MVRNTRVNSSVEAAIYNKLVESKKLQEEDNIHMVHKDDRGIRESAGDIILRKFIYIYHPNNDVETLNKFFEPNLLGYYIEKSCIYNTRTLKAKYPPTHSEMINDLPFEIRKDYRNDKGIWGKDDLGYDNKVTKFVSDRPDGIPISVYNKVRNYFNN